MPPLFSAFTDELSPDLEEALGLIRKEGIRHAALRVVEGRNIQELSAERVRKVKRVVAAAGLKLSVLGTAFGKTSLADEFGPERDRLRRAFDHALFLECPNVRIFSFYPKDPENPWASRGETIERLQEAASLAGEAGVTLLLENERRIFGDTGVRNFDLLTEVNSPRLRAAFDFANYVQCGVDPPARAWVLVREFVADFHLKDARRSDGRVVKVGEGDGGAVAIFREAARMGFSGFLTFEPHLQASEERTGFTGPRLFPEAVAAAKRALEEAGLAWG